MDDDSALGLEQLATGGRRKALSPELRQKLAQQDWRIYGLLARHRAGEAVMEELLGELLPDVSGRSARYRPVRLHGRDDLAQELTLELIRLADTLPLKGPEFVTRRLMLGAAKRVTRRLKREWYRQLATTLLADFNGIGMEVGE